MAVEGDCAGNDILPTLSVTREECAGYCTDNPMCIGWIYVLSGTETWRYPPCHLKTVMCLAPSQVAGLVITSYYKPPGGKYIPLTI